MPKDVTTIMALHKFKQEDLVEAIETKEKVLVDFLKIL